MNARTRDLLLAAAGHGNVELGYLTADPESWVAQELGPDLVERALREELPALTGSFVRGVLLERAIGVDRMLNDRLAMVSRRTPVTS